MINTINVVNKDFTKKFYGKAKIIESAGFKYLKSYNTIVCAIDADNNFLRLWDGWSSTTSKHVDGFLRLYGFNAINKKEWEKMEVQKINIPALVQSVNMKYAINYYN